MLRFLAVALAMIAARGLAQSRTVDQISTAQNDDERSHWQIQTGSLIVAYAVRSPRSPVTWERRRLVQQVGLDHALLLDDPRDSRWRLISHLDLRLDQEFGQVCRRNAEGCLRETDVDARREFQPLVDDSRLDMPAAWVGLRGPLGQVSLGRVLVVDATGFARLDGGRAVLRPSRWSSIEAYAGRQTRDTSFASGPGFETQGSIRIDLPDSLARERVPWIEEPSPTWMTGGKLAIGAERIVQARLAFREVQDRDGLVARRVAVGLTSRPVAALALRSDIVWDPTDGTVVDAFGEIEVAPIRPVRLRARVSHHEPRFDLGSIWAWFDLVPVDQGRLSARWKGERVELGGALAGRRAVQRERTERDIGGEGWVSIRRGGWRSSLRGWMWAGDLSPVAAVLLDLRRVLTVVELYLRASVWHFDQPFQQELYATSLTSALGVAAQLTDNTRLRFEIEWAYNRIVGHRVRGLASVVLKAWR
ncbi:MAG: hypothetical protein AAGE52_35600 [Myxococcota bacterium]